MFCFNLYEYCLTNQKKMYYIDSKYFYTPIILELVRREFASTTVKVSIEALQIVVCKCTKDCFRYHIQKPDFRITSTWLDQFIRQNKLDEKYSVRQKPHSSFPIRFEFKDETTSSSSTNASNQPEQSYVILPSSGLKIYKVSCCLFVYLNIFLMKI